MEKIYYLRIVTQNMSANREGYFTSEIERNKAVDKFIKVVEDDIKDNPDNGYFVDKLEDLRIEKYEIPLNVLELS